MRRAKPDTMYSYTSAANPVTFTVAAGETFQVETVPCCGRQFDSHTGREDPQAELGINPSAGCIAVEGATPGQVLVVHVLGIDLHEYGFTRLTWPNPLLPSMATEQGWKSTFKAVRLQDGFIQWSPKLNIPLAPMIGTIGVARPNEVLSNAHNGVFGGNFDVPEITIGSRVHLPVMVDKALLHIGDVHAIQGDGEIDGVGGIETAGVLTLKCELTERPASFRNPRIQSDDFIATVGFDRPAEAAFSQALADLIHWMVDEFRFTGPDAHMLLAQVLEARVTQFVNPLFTYFCKVRRKYLLPD